MDKIHTSFTLPHKFGHTVGVLDLDMVTPEDVGPRRVFPCEPVAVFLHRVPVPTGVEYGRVVPGAKKIKGGKARSNK